MNKQNKKILLEIKNVKVYFNIKKKSGLFSSKIEKLKAVDNVSLSVKEGEVLGVVGESGCGKSTFARSIVNLVNVTEGEILWLGKPIHALSQKNLRETRLDIQMIFQDPLASLNPRMTIGDIIAEPLIENSSLSKTEIKARVQDLMEKVGLLPNVINRYPHEFSGGQCQRIGIARALILEPKLIICDEPVSALDVSIQAQIINLLKELQQKMNLSLIFIAHDLAIVKHISDRVLVMYLGNPVEIGHCKDIFENPKHPYTKALFSAIPTPDPNQKYVHKELLKGDLPSPINPPKGCVFNTRCPIVGKNCYEQKPELKGNSHKVACLKVEM